MEGFARRGLGIALALIASTSAVSCYSTNNGVTPPDRTLYFPAGLAVSPGGKALYVANSNFDLQYDGGTLQSFDLTAIRAAALQNIRNFPSRCPASAAVRPGFDCAVPATPDAFWRRTVKLGAFASDLLLTRTSHLSAANVPQRRMFLPVRGSGTVTWLDVDDDAQNPNADPFALRCDAGTDGRCGASHESGANATEPGNSRGITMPGEPFGMALSFDDQAMVVTHQSKENVSLFDTGIIKGRAERGPALQFVLDRVPNGGVAAAAVPYGPELDMLPGGAPRPAFLMTSRSDIRVSLLRTYSDESNGASATLRRPFMLFERSYEVRANAGGSDSRGIIIDESPRIRCRAEKRGSTTPGTSGASGPADCGKVAARVFIANRSPASLLIGEMGGTDGRNGNDFDPDRIVVARNIPLSNGPSKLYLAPIVDADGRYALRLFVACFDSAIVFVIDPERGLVENTLRVGPGPHAMAFDPFDMEAAATFALAPSATSGNLRPYRFGYLASFTDSFVQVIDLDRSDTTAVSFEKVVFNLGIPTPPRGSP
jgi:hypothetical protein